MSVIAFGVQRYTKASLVSPVVSKHTVYPVEKCRVTGVKRQAL